MLAVSSAGAQLIAYLASTCWDKASSFRVIALEHLNQHTEFALVQHFMLAQYLQSGSGYSRPGCELLVPVNIISLTCKSAKTL